MTPPEFALQGLPIALAAIGTTFLVREVDKAHKVEEISGEMAVSKELLALYQTDLREFWIRSFMRSSNHDRATVERMATSLGDAAIKAGVAEFGQFYQQTLPQAVQRWYALTVPAALKKRHRDLWIGFWLLIAALGVQFTVAAGKLLGY